MNRDERLALDGCQEPLLFYRPEDPNGCLSMFSDHSVILPDPWIGKLRVYRAGEYRFQAKKGSTQACHDYVCEAATCSEAKWRGGPKSKLIFRDDWGNDYGDMCWYAMLETCLAKALQHMDVEIALRNSGKRRIYEDSPTDDIWGWRYQGDYRGKNLLGRAWMQTRFMIL